MMKQPARTLALAAAIGFLSLASAGAFAATIVDADIFNGSETVTVSSKFNNAAFAAGNVVDGLNKAFVFANDNNQRLSITGFNSAIETLRFFDTPSYSRRLADAVTVYYSAASTTSLDPNDYTLVGTYVLPGLDAFDNNGINDVYTNLTSPADHPLASDPASHPERTIAYADASGLGIPAGTQSILLKFKPSDTASTPIGIGLSEIQAFAVPEPSALVLLMLAAATLVAGRWLK